MTVGRNNPGVVYAIDSAGGLAGLRRLLEISGVGDVVANLQKPILIKPNLVENLHPPITTPVSLVRDLIQCLKEHNAHCPILVGEGCGSLKYDTKFVFDELGYTALSEEMGVELVDLNVAALVHKTNDSCRRWPEMYLPELLFDTFLLSVPVLKAHSLADVTLSMKNMMGVVPPKYYQQGGHWKKASFHHKIHEAVFDLNQYRKPDFVLLDASVGMQEAHLWGPTCDPPKRKYAVSFDPVALDSYGAGLLGKNWGSVGHIKMAHGILGTASPLNIHHIPCPT